jgi:hypothetical protein
MTGKEYVNILDFNYKLIMAMVERSYKWYLSTGYAEWYNRLTTCMCIVFINGDIMETRFKSGLTRCCVLTCLRGSGFAIDIALLSVIK